MEYKENLKSEEMLEKIFYYMNQLAVEKDFSASVLSCRLTKDYRRGS